MIGLLARVGALGVLVAAASAAAHAAVPVRLPPGEDATAWAEPLRLADLAPGDPGAGPWVEIVGGGPLWTLRVRDARGRVQEVRVPAPATARDREDLALLARALLRPTTGASWEDVRALPPLAAPAPGPAAPVSASAPTSSPPGAGPSSAAPAPAAATAGSTPPTAPATPRPASASPAPKAASAPAATSATAPSASPTTSTARPAPTGASAPARKAASSKAGAAAAKAAGTPPAAEASRGGSPAPSTPASGPAAGAGSPAPGAAAATAAPGPAEAAGAGPPPGSDAETATTAPAPRGLRAWARLGAGLAWRPDTALAGALGAAGGVELGRRVEVGAAAEWSPARALATLGADRSAAALDLTVGASLRLVPAGWLAAGAHAGLSIRAYDQDGLAVATTTIPIAVATLDARVPIDGPVTLVPYLDGRFDLRPTELRIGEEVAAELPRFEVRAGVRIDLRRID